MSVIVGVRRAIHHTAYSDTPVHDQASCSAGVWRQTRTKGSRACKRSSAFTSAEERIPERLRHMGRPAWTEFSKRPLAAVTRDFAGMWFGSMSRPSRSRLFHVMAAGCLTNQQTRTPYPPYQTQRNSSITSYKPLLGHQQTWSPRPRNQTHRTPPPPQATLVPSRSAGARPSAPRPASSTSTIPPAATSVVGNTP